MSKYKELFNALKLENEAAGEQEIRKTGNTESGKQVKPENSKAGKTSVPAKKAEEKQVSLGVKVAESRRRFWVGQAKLQGMTISEVIISALSKKFGEPD